MKRVTVFFVLLAMATNILAWGPKGHRIVAQVAYDLLDAKARKQVDKLLGTRGMIYLSTWPDEIKSDTIYPTSFTCHYQDLDGGMSDSAVVATLRDYPEEGGDLFMALDSLELVLQRKAPHKDALVFYVHLMADRFCPMHMAHLDDKGGNAAGDYTEETFFVDTTMPTLEITGVADQSANNGDVIPVVSYSDTNYDAEKVTITLTGANR